MCNQSVGLIAAAMERVGIATVCISLVRSIAEKMRAPRSLVVPFAFGYPLDRPNDAEAQRRVVQAGLELIGSKGPGPVLKQYGAGD